MRHKIVLLLVFLVAAAVLLEVVGLVRLGVTLKSYATYWNDRNSNGTGELVYVALGDSTAQGIGADSPQRGYVGLLARHIEQKTGKSVRIVNLSRSGAKIHDVLETQLPRLSHYHPDIVTVEIGANDLVSFNKQTFAEQFSTLAAQLPPGTVVSNMPNFGGRLKRPAEVAEANKIIQASTLKNGLPMADLFGVTKSRESVLNYAPDWFHPNNRGYRNWEAAFWAALKPKLNQL